MIELKFQAGDLQSYQQKVVSDGFFTHSNERSAPTYKKERINWLACEDDGRIIGALTADILWDWIYIDKLWVDEAQRGQGLGKKLMNKAEEYAVNARLTGIWLWTQSWQAAEFYERLGYEEFTRFKDFPKGHSRIGLRKTTLNQEISTTNNEL